jgi:hypothetical protein
MLLLDHNAVRKKPRIKTSLEWRPLHGKSVRNSGPDLAPPRLRRLRGGIFLQPVRTVLVRRGNRAAADAGRRRGLPVPGVFEEDGGENTIILRVARESSGQRFKFAARNPGSNLRFNYFAGSKHPAWRDH